MTREWSAPESAKLGDIIAVAVRAVIAGADNRVDIESFGNAKIDWFKTFLELPNGIPSHDTFRRVFSLIDVRNFQDLFIEWTKRDWEAAEGRVVEIDCKTVRRSADKANGESLIHMASAWATANGGALGQVKTDDRSNEITAIPKPLKTLEIKGCVVTIDAMGRRKKIARAIVKQGADYVLAVKRTRFSSVKHDVFETVNKGHGRVERRRSGDLRPVRGRTRERPRRVGERRDDGSQAILHKLGLTGFWERSVSVGEWRTVLTGRRRIVRGGREREGSDARRITCRRSGDWR